MTGGPVVLRRSETLLPAALRILDAERARLLPALPGADLVLTGSSSIPGLLTRGDVDLHLRVPPEQFDPAVILLLQTTVAVNRAIWTDAFATFETDAHELAVGIALTAIGDEHDSLFRRTWSRLAADPGLVDGFNAVKLEHRGDLDGYLAAKRRFLDAL